MTVQDLVTRALVLNGVCGPGRTPGPEQSAVGLQLFISMISSWENQQLYLYSLLKGIYLLSAGTASYTIGPSAATFTAPRPTRIEAAGILIPVSGGSSRSYTDLVIASSTTITSVIYPFASGDVGSQLTITGGTGFIAQTAVILSVTGGTATVDRNLGTPGSSSGIGTTHPPGSLRFPLEVLTADQWNQVPNQADTSAQVKRLYDDYAAPNSNLYVHPVPSIVCSLELYTWQQLPNFAALGDTFTGFPDGYERAITHGLAVESAPAFGRPVSKELALIAEQAKDTLQAKNRLLFPAPPAPVKAA